jgi:hypothetical protein
MTPTAIHSPHALSLANVYRSTGCARDTTGTPVRRPTPAEMV